MNENNVNTNTESIETQTTSIENTPVDSATENKSEGKVFTEEEVNAIITKRLAKEKVKQEKAVEEAKRLASMSSEERAKEELRLEREAFENERNSYLEEKNLFDKQKMLTQTEKELINNSLPTEFAKYLVNDDADKTFENIKEFKELWDKALQNNINNILKSNAKEPKKSTSNNQVIEWKDVLENPALLPAYNKQHSK